jgi:signal transduction histidine kinase
VGGRLPLFWKILLLAAAVSLVPLAFAMLVSLNSATDVTESLLKQNLMQMSKQVAERTSYTLVSIDSDLDVMGELPLTKTAFVAFSHAQRRELYSGSGDARRMEAVPKYREVAFYHPSGTPEVVVVDDVAVVEPDRFEPHANRWCEGKDFVEAALESPGEPVVAGLVGCHFEVEQYAPAEGRLGRYFSGGIRVSKAVTDEDGQVRGVATLVLSQLHLVWALQSLRRPGEDDDVWAMMVDRDGWVVAHPDPRFTKGPDRAGNPVEGNSWEGGRSVRLDQLAGDVGELFGTAVRRANSGARSTAVIDEGPAGHWVVAVHPIEAELGPFAPSYPMGAVMVLYPRAKALEVTGQLERTLAALILVTVFLVLLGSALLAGHIARPIRRLSVAARQIATGRPRKVPEERGDEIGELARAFNRMQKDLEVSREALLRAERLAAIGRFVSGIVHETKNVLASVGNYVTVLDRKVEPDVRDRVVAPMRRALQQMDKLVVRLRELSLKPKFASTDIESVLAHTVELVDNQAKNRQITITLDAPANLHIPRADASLLGQVFLNLLINAMDATPQGGTIIMTAQAVAGEVVVRVKDSGSGLPEIPAGKLLEPFFTTKPGGTGLGLYICSSIIERHNGAFSIDNHPQGGAVAEVRLQAAPEGEGR